MKDTLGELLRQVRRGELTGYVRPGECLEVHSSEGELGNSEPCPVETFIEGWACAMETRPSVIPGHRYLGIVHESGAVLIVLS